MRTEWFALSLKSGKLKIATPPRAARSKHWIERDIENIIALNPEFLGVEDHQPLRLRGERTTVSSPDQAYIDELGRAVVVEAKRIRAGLPALAQGLAYADHWRLLPAGEIDKGLCCLADKRLRAERFGKTLDELRQWADAKGHRRANAGEILRLGNDVVRRLKTKTLAKGVTDIRSYSRACCGADRLPFVGAPARVLVVAPDFTDECIEIAEGLIERRVAVELLKVEILKSRDGVYIGRTWIQRDEYAEPTWRLLRRLWSSSSEIREQFLLNGWADALNSKSFSLSAKDVVDARLWFNASDRKVDVWTVVPNGWYSSDRSRRKELRRMFLAAMPRNLERTEMYEVGAWVGWEFDLPDRRGEAEHCIRELAGAVLNVLVTRAPSARA